MPTPLELRESLPLRLSSLGLSNATFADLAGWSTAEMSRFLSGKKIPRADEAMRLHTTLLDLEKLAEASVVPVDFTNAVLIRQLLEQMNNGTLNIKTTNPARMKKILATLEEQSI